MALCAPRLSSEGCWWSLVVRYGSPSEKPQGAKTVSGCRQRVRPGGSHRVLSEARLCKRGRISRLLQGWRKQADICQEPQTKRLNMPDSQSSTEQIFSHEVWQLDIEDRPWAQNTVGDVDFVSKTLDLTGHERILDLACGVGRH